MSHMCEGSCLRSNEKRTFPASFASHVLACTLAAKQIAVSKQNHNWFSLIRSDPTSSWSQPRSLHREKRKRNTSHSHRRFEMWFSNLTRSIHASKIGVLKKKCTEAASFFSSSSRSFSPRRQQLCNCWCRRPETQRKIQADLGDFPIPQWIPPDKLYTGPRKDTWSDFFHTFVHLQEIYWLHPHSSWFLTSSLYSPITKLLHDSKPRHNAEARRSWQCPTCTQSVAGCHCFSTFPRPASSSRLQGQGVGGSAICVDGYGNQTWEAGQQMWKSAMRI